MTNSLKLLSADLERRFRSPIKSVTFYLHLSMAVIVGGGFGIWYEIVFKGIIRDEWNVQAISAALFAYFPAIVAMAVIDFIHEGQPYLRSFGLGAAGMFVVIFCLAVATSPCVQLIWAVLGSVLAILFWWTASGEKDCFKDIVPCAATPDPSQPLSGDKSGWKT